VYANQEETRVARATEIPKELLEQFTDGPMTAEAIEDASTISGKLSRV